MHIPKRIRAVVAILAIVTHLPCAKAGESGNANLTPEEISELTAYVSKEKMGKAALSWKKEDDWFQSVIIENGEKITFAYFPAGEGSKQMFSVWWRKVGTSGQKTLWASGVNTDGITHGGVDPEKKRVALLDLWPEGDSRRGTEFTSFWQTELNKRLHAGLKYYRRK